MIIIKVFQEYIYYHKLLPSQRENINKPKDFKFLFQYWTCALPYYMRMVDTTTSLIQASIPMSSSDKLVNNPLVSSHTTTHSEMQTEAIVTNTAVKQLFPQDLWIPTEGTDHLFNARRFTNVYVADLAILLTFGSIYPPLAVTIFICILVNSVMIQLSIGRFITLIRKQADQSSWSVLEETMKRETAAVGPFIIAAIPPITIPATIFWSFYLFDILGDEKGTKKAIWIIFILPGCQFLMEWLPVLYEKLINFCHMNMKQTTNQSSSAFITKRESEMTQLFDHQ
jgi:hypothetical protein